MTVEWTDKALTQLRGIHDYIARDSDFFAKRMVDRLTSRSIQIRDHPFSGETVCRFNNPMRKRGTGVIHSLTHRVEISTLISRPTLNQQPANCGGEPEILQFGYV